MACQETVFKRLRERGFRLTPQREMVLAVLHNMQGFTTAEEIFGEVQALSSSVDISTVYRTLDLLQDFGVVAVVEPGDGPSRYELVGVRGAQLHRVCPSSGEVISVDSEPIRPFADHIENHFGFKADLDRLSVPGLCQECWVARERTSTGEK